MKKNTKKNDELKDAIKPEDIVMEQQDDDSDMPVPETKTYKKVLKCTETFMQLFRQCTNSLPYNTILSNNENANKLRLVDFVKYVESKKDKIAVDEMNNVISYIANLDFEHARPLMEVIENKEAQRSLWVITEE